MADYSQYAVNGNANTYGYNIPYQVQNGDTQQSLAQKFGIGMNNISIGNTNSGMVNGSNAGQTAYLRFLAGQSVPDGIIQQGVGPRPIIKDGTSTYVAPGQPIPGDFTATGPNGGLNAIRAQQVAMGQTPTDQGAVLGQTANQNATINQPATGLGSAAQTNALLGTNSFNTTTGAPNPTPTTTTTTGTSTGTTGSTTGGSSTGNSSLDSYLQSYLNSLSPSSDETNAQNQLNALQSQQSGINASRDLGIEAVNEQPIATPFLTGQGAAITNRAAVQSGALGAQQVPLQQQLATAQAKRQSAVDVSKALLDYQTNQQKTAQSGQFSLSPGQTQYDAQGNAIASAPGAKLDTSTVEVNGRKLLINSQTGQTIQDLGAATSSTGNTTDQSQINSFNKDAAAYIEKLGSNTTSWATAFNALKAQYPQASNELIDQTLGKDKYYTVTGK